MMGRAAPDPARYQGNGALALGSRPAGRPSRAHLAPSDDEIPAPPHPDAWGRCSRQVGPGCPGSAALIRMAGKALA